MLLLKPICGVGWVDFWYCNSASVCDEVILLHLLYDEPVLPVQQPVVGHNKLPSILHLLYDEPALPVQQPVVGYNKLPSILHLLYDEPGLGPALPVL